MQDRFCHGCNKPLRTRYQEKFCSNRCQFDYQHRDFIESWKKGLKSGNIGVSTRAISAHLKKYLLEKFDSKCVICSWGKKHPRTGKVPVEVDHIDGDSENNTEANLRLICPNCHSLSENYKALNKGKGRKWRMNKYIKNKVIPRPKQSSLLP